jgi:hypothetical protein
LAARLSILSSFVVGVVLVFAPWLPLADARWLPLWDANWLLQLWPEARGPLLSAFTRGAVTGIGLVNLLLAARDLYARLVGEAPHGEPERGREVL